jgi:O-antigen/teichoic acid export membrane protein
LIALIVALRWISELYRGVVTGFERLVWLSGLNIAIATCRFVLVIPLFIFVGSSPVQFFSYQLFLGVVEVVLLVTATYRLMPTSPEEQGLSLHLQPLREVLHFSLAIAFTSSVWVFVTQTDKLILSKLLPLSEYAYFTLAVLLASGVSILSGPISTALMPRMVRLNAADDEEGMIRLYRNAAQMVAVIAIPTALVLALFSEKVLWAWTGNQEIAHFSAPVLTLYALGNGILALSAFPYYFQFAKGDLKLHLIGSMLYVLLLVPLLIWATIRFGVIGAGYAWLGSNAVYFFLWVPRVHRRFVKGLHKSWLQHDLAGIAVSTGLSAAVARYSVRFSSDRISVAVLVLSIGLVLVMIAGAASSCVRGIVSERLWTLSRREML